MIASMSCRNQPSAKIVLIGMRIHPMLVIHEDEWIVRNLMWETDFVDMDLFGLLRWGTRNGFINLSNVLLFLANSRTNFFFDKFCSMLQRTITCHNMIKGCSSILDELLLQQLIFPFWYHFGTLLALFHHHSHLWMCPIGHINL